MKVVHIESGLGNQMLSYCEFLAMKKTNPDEECYIEKIIYEIPEANEYISQWNGYELERVFNIHAPDYMDTLSEELQMVVIEEIKKSQFWLHDWNWPVYFQKAFETAGVYFINARGDFEADKAEWSISRKGDPPLSYKIKQTGLYANLRRIYRNIRKSDVFSDKDYLFYSSDEDQLIGQRLTFKNMGSGIERIDDEIRKAFIFPEIDDEVNRNFANQIRSCESVAIHARRGDMLTVSGKYYRSGYFRRAVQHIKKNVDKPVFFFFCDSSSVDWCRIHPRIFGLNYDKDKVIFVDCNCGATSYRDMQLMTMCKHNIITNSSFGWWGAYLNKNPVKITISPELEINTTYHC